MKKLKNIIKLLCIVLFGVILRFIIGFFGGGDIAETTEYSILVKEFGIVPIIAVMFFITYLLWGLVFTYFEDKLRGKKNKKGLLYGSLFGLLWFFGMIEASVVKNTLLIDEIIFGLEDATPLIVMGFLLGVLLGSDSEENFGWRISKSSLALVLKVGLIYLFGRYISYLLQMESAYLIRPFGTFFWTFGNGLLIGIIYIYLRDMVLDYLPIKRAIIFSVIIFGSNWLLFNLFVPLIIEVPLFKIIWSFFMRVVFDIIYIFIAIGLFDKQKFINNKKTKIQSTI